MLCMALAVTVSFQAYLGLMDRMDHADNLVHFPNPLAGDIEYCSGPMGVCTDDTSTHHENMMHHHGDAAIIYLPAQFFVLPVCASCIVIPADFISEAPRAPDPPPKMPLEIRI